MPRISALQGERQLINKDGKFLSTTKSFIEELKQHCTALSPYMVVSIIGPQNSGKSSLLNAVFGTNFDVLNPGGTRRQITKGIWISRCINPCMILMDVEGSDGNERKDLLFERQSTLFALTVSDVMLLNMWFTDIGRREGASSSLLKTVFQERLLISGVQKTTVIICIRDHDNTQCSPEKTEEDVQKRINEIWKEVHPPSTSNHIMSDYINVIVKDFPSRRYEETEFIEKCDDLAQTLCSIAASDNVGRKYYASSFVFGSELIWNLISDNKRLNAADHQVAMDAYMCGDITNQIVSSIEREKGYQHLMQAEDINTKEFNKLMSLFIDNLLLKYETDTNKMDKSTRDEKKATLDKEIFLKLKPICDMKIKTLSSEIISLAISEVQKDLDKLKNPNELTNALVDSYKNQFKKNCGDVHPLFECWCREQRKQLKHNLRTTVLKAATDLHQKLQERDKDNTTATVWDAIKTGLQFVARTGSIPGLQYLMDAASTSRN